MNSSVIKYHVGEHDLIDSGAFPGIILEVGKTLERFKSWGLNPKGVSTEDFDFAFAIPVGGPGSAKVGFHPRPVLVAQHNVTKRHNAYDVILMSVYGTYPTAVNMVSLATKTDDD
jgi:hypothetical protein